MCFRRRLIISLKLYLLDCADWGFNTGIHVFIFFTWSSSFVYIFLFLQKLNIFWMNFLLYRITIILFVLCCTAGHWFIMRHCKSQERMKSISLNIDVASLNCFKQNDVKRDIWKNCIIHWFTHVQEIVDGSWLAFLSMSFHLVSNPIKSRFYCIMLLHQELPLFSIGNIFSLVVYFTHFHSSRPQRMEYDIGCVLWSVARA